MHKKFEINQTKIKGSCQSGRKVGTHNSMSDLPLELNIAKKYRKGCKSYLMTLSKYLDLERHGRGTYP